LVKISLFQPGLKNTLVAQCLFVIPIKNQTKLNELTNQQTTQPYS